ncbi:hypothetical protein KFK09_011928 [Dendrobium nobile]|uniref:Uncharacterized protein n=1 Tax=Dendrobium nobile TaxID=94219 RepID=A0A8T3BFW2_DENNO|nr:hypothetical protein KFK09_011928 [Dendrobium nobile]
MGLLDRLSGRGNGFTGDCRLLRCTFFVGRVVSIDSKYKMMWNYFFPEDEQDPQRQQYKVKNLKSSHFTRRKHKGEVSQPAILISVTLMEYKVENLISFLYNVSNTPMMVRAMDFSPPLRDCSVLNVVKLRLLDFELL